MQRTRVSTIATITGDRLGELFSNPWRRISLLLISLLFGIFVGQAVSTTAGQTSSWDVVVAGIILVFTEVINRFAYSKTSNSRSLLKDFLNTFKIGVTYSLFLEAFKLGS